MAGKGRLGPGIREEWGGGGRVGAGVGGLGMAGLAGGQTECGVFPCPLWLVSGHR